MAPTVILDRCLTSAPFRFWRLSRLLSVNASAWVIRDKRDVTRSSMIVTGEEFESNVEDDSDRPSTGDETDR